MKTTIRLSALALLALGSATLASAVTVGTTATFTLAGTVSEEEGGFPNNDDPYFNETKKGSVTTTEDKSKIVVTRVGVKEVLQEMLDNGEIAGPITGWSILGVGVSDEVSEEYGYIDGPLLFAVKTGQAPVSVDATFSGIAGVATSSGKIVSDSAKVTETITGSGTYKGALNFSLLGRETSCIATASDKYVKGNLKVGTESIPYGMYVAGAVSLKGIVGGVRDESDGGLYEAVIEGSASLAAAKVADVESFESAFIPAAQ